MYLLIIFFYLIFNDWYFILLKVKYLVDSTNNLSCKTFFQDSYYVYILWFLHHIRLSKKRLLLHKFPDIKFFFRFDPSFIYSTDMLVPLFFLLASSQCHPPFILSIDLMIRFLLYIFTYILPFFFDVFLRIWWICT